MPDPKDRDDEAPPAEPATGESGRANFETRIDHSAVAATAVGDGSQASGTMHLGGVTVHGTAIFAGVAPSEPLAGTASGSKPTPNYPDDETRLVSEKLADAQARKQRLQQHGVDTAEVVREILDLKRRLREGGQLRPGDSLGDGRYLLLDVLGRGGFATVWRAHDANTDEVVAIKVLHSNLAGDRVRLDRFKRGARIMAELQHEAVVRVLEPYGEDGGWHYFVMEYMQRRDLRRAVIEQRLSPEQAVAAILRVSEALAEAHAQGIVHRDVKPANILLDQDFVPKLSDFDLVNVEDTTGGTRTGALGTAIYAAPELLTHPMDADARADVFGLGMCVVFCLHGRELPAHIMGHADQLIDTLPCAAEVKNVLKRATGWRTPALRHRNAAAFREALEATLRPRRRYDEVADPDATAANRVDKIHDANASRPPWITGKVHCPPHKDVPALRVERLELSNLKNVTSLKLDLTGSSSTLPGQASCLLGPNGAGKTTVLQGISLALLGDRALLELDQEELHKLRRRVGEVFADAEVRAWVREGTVLHELSISLGAALDPHAHIAHHDLARMRAFWSRFRSEYIFATYGVSRSLYWNPGERRNSLATAVRPQMHLFDVLVPASGSAFLLGHDEMPAPVLATFTDLVNAAFGDDSFCVVEEHDVRFSMQGTVVSSNLLSTGYRATLAWLLDLCAAWHERAPAAAERRDYSSMHGIVLIDEIDLHLHPDWQSKIVPQLRRMLPGVQWIVSTHSPLVEFSFEPSEVIAIESGQRVERVRERWSADPP